MTSTIEPAAAVPAKLTVVFRLVRPRCNSGSVRLAPSTRTSSIRPIRVSVPLRRRSLDDLDEPLESLVLHLVRYLIGKRGSLRPRTRRVDERERTVESHVLHQCQCLLKVVLALAGKTDDEIGSQRKVRDGSSQTLDEPEVSVAIVRPAHRFQHTRRARLRGQVNVLAHARALRHRRDDGFAKVLRVWAREADPLDARYVVTRPKELAELRGQLGREIAAPGVDVLAEQGYLPHAALGEPRDLGDDLPRPPALLAAANGRDDAVRAHGVAAHGHLDPCLEAPFAAYREISREMLMRAESTARDRVATGFNPLAEVRDRPGAEGDIDERVSLEDLLSLRLCIAAADGDDDVGSSPLQRARVSEVGSQPRVRLLADRAGVEHDHVGLVGSDRLAEPERLEHALDALRVVRVHLAAECRDVVPTHRDQG